MKTFEIKSCYHCPFHVVFQEGPGAFCYLGMEEKLPYTLIKEDAPIPPEWCPIIKGGPVLVTWEAIAKEGSKNDA